MVILPIFDFKVDLIQKKILEYKSELLSAMTLCKSFLKSMILMLFSDILVIMGKATKSHRTYENNDVTKRSVKIQMDHTK
jgi:hypothetical protein